MSRNTEIALAGKVVEIVPRARGGLTLSVQAGRRSKPLRVFVPEGAEVAPGDRVICQGIERYSPAGRPLLEALRCAPWL